MHRWARIAARPRMPRRRTVAPRSGGMLLVVLLLGVVGLVGAEPGKWDKSAVFIKGKWTQFDENDEAGVPQPYPPRTDSWMQNDTSIMVSISSFRDYRCPKTLYNLFTYVSRGLERGGICMSYTTLEMCARSHISARSHPWQKTRDRAALGRFEWGCLCVRVLLVRLCVHVCPSHVVSHPCYRRGLNRLTFLPHSTTTISRSPLHPSFTAKPPTLTGSTRASSSKTAKETSTASMATAR